jgi:phage baseplate assembly protein V
MDYDSDSVFPVNKTGRDSEVRNLTRHGKVTEVLEDPEQVQALGPCVRVQYLDKEGLISKFLPVKQNGSRSTSSFYCPKVGDDVSVTMLPNGNEDGFVDGSFYNAGNPPPITDPDTRHIKFNDGTVIEYTEKAPAGVLKRGTAAGGAGSGTFTFNSVGPMVITTSGPISIKAGGAITIEASSITLKAGTITLDGNVHVTGSLTVDGAVDFKAGGKIAPHLTNTDGSGGGS